MTSSPMQAAIKKSRGTDDFRNEAVAALDAAVREDAEAIKVLVTAAGDRGATCVCIDGPLFVSICRPLRHAIEVFGVNVEVLTPLVGAMVRKHCRENIGVYPLRIGDYKLVLIW